MSLATYFEGRRPRRPRSAFIVVLLLLTLGLAGLLAHQAYTAAKSHRAVAERTLGDYAAFAAWKFSGVIKSELLWIYGMALYPLVESNAASCACKLPDPSAFVIPPEKAKYIPPRLILSYFRLDLGHRHLATRGAVVPRDLRAWIADTLPRHALHLYGPDWKSASINGVVAGRPETIVYMLAKDRTGAPLAATGFVLNQRALHPILERLYGDGQYLPPALVGGLDTDALISLAVRAADGRMVYRSPRQYGGSFAAEDSVGTSLGVMTARVTLRPEVAERLVIGGLPHSRLPTLLGLLAVTTGLIGAALLQHRREYELAALRAEFVSNVSHELRTPLAQIRMFAETLILGRVRSDDERRRSLEIIDQEARRLTHLVENVLHFSRSERRVLRVAPEPTDLSHLVHQIVDAFLPLARARQVEIRLELDRGLAAPVDRGAVSQILLNLLDNAVKYGPTGQVVTVGTSTAGDRVWIRVDDEGPGVPGRDRERVWERFSRLDRDGASAVAGTGIGLGVVRDLVRLHGGRVWVDEAPGGGARFVVELPKAAGPLEGAREDEEEAATQIELPGLGVAGSGAEDHPAGVLAGNGDSPSSRDAAGLETPAAGAGQPLGTAPAQERQS